MLPRVSQVLNILDPFALDYVTDGDLARGTRLHAYMEIYARCLVHTHVPSTPSPKMFSSDEQRRLLACTNWAREAKISFTHAEHRFVSEKYLFCGHPDAVGVVGVWKGQIWGLDWKFAESITALNEIQGEAYRHLVPECHGVALVQCKADATIHVHKLKPRPDLWALFLNALAVWQWRNRHGNGTGHV